ncbi:DUF7059 domain-containing protein [Pseudarthrobacter sp. J1738]|uniref:DUF7059 domain-containing protein n=1 Tax=Pseudarthrobacter sp. J1738 TaxID=3420446 RepID=UPI003D2765B6
MEIPNSNSLELLADLAADLRAAAYTLEGVEQFLGASAWAALNRDQLIPALLVSEQHDADPLSVIVQLWLLARPQSEERINNAFPTLAAAGLAELGLVEVSGASENGPLISALVDLRPYGWDANADGSGGAELWVASDLGAHQRPGVLRKDHVLGIGQASTTLVQMTARRHVARALDLGTGCGVQTFHLLHHAEHVTATDISKRALAFTRFNILLNAAALEVNPEALEERVSLRLGSLLEPVEGECFDLVVSNPPFVITPRVAGESTDEQFTYRDGGLPGDDIVSQLVTSLPSILNPGGTAQMLGNWEVVEGATWDQRPRTWIPENTDAWFIQREQIGPEQYAETWLQDASEGRDPRLYAQAYNAYLQDFRSRNVEAIGFGMIWLRRPMQEPAYTGERSDGGTSPQRRIFRFEEITYPIEQPTGPHIGAAVERADWLAARTLGNEYLVVAEDVTEERHQRPGAEHPGVILLRQGAGLRRTNLLSTELAGLVSASDGELTVGQLVEALASLLGGDEDFDRDAFTRNLLQETANLLVDGFLIPAETE